MSTKRSREDKIRDFYDRPRTDPYEVLEVSSNASASEIKTAFRRAAKTNHPDRRGGDEAKFKEIVEAYDVLSDPEKRAIFDHYGVDGLRRKAPSPPPASTWRPAPYPRSRRAARQMDSWENVYVGVYNGVQHYHFGPVEICAGCGMGIVKQVPVDADTEDLGVQVSRREGDETLPGAAYFARAAKC